MGKHARRFTRDQTIYDPSHYVPVLARKPGGGGFLDSRRNAVLVGTGKTRRAIAVGRARVRSGTGMRFYNTVDLVNRLGAEARAGKPGRIAAHLSPLDLVILDELGYLPFALSGGQLPFHLVGNLYEEARQALRNLVKLVTAEPCRDGRGVDLIVHGRLAQILQIAQNRPDAGPGGCMFSLVAGTQFHRCRTRFRIVQNALVGRAPLLDRVV